MYLGELEEMVYSDRLLSQEVRMIFGLLVNKHERKYASYLY